MRGRFSIGAALLCGCATVYGAAPKAPEESVSASHQFVVVCDQKESRIKVTTYCEEVKTQLLGVLGVGDFWKFPIVVSLRDSDPGRAASTVRMFEASVGLKIDVDINLAGDLSGVHLEQELLKALMLEMAYRDYGNLSRGTEYSEPPPWLVRGMARYLETRDSGADASVYRSLIQANKLPTFADFLGESPAGMDATSLALYDACSLSLVQLLVDLPDGRSRLASYIRGLAAGGDQAENLLRKYPMLGSSADGLEKWWTLGIARLSASDRYQGLNADDTEQRLEAALHVTLPTQTGKGKGVNAETKDYKLEEFAQYMKNPQKNAALFRMNAGLVSLSAQANPLFRSVIADYQAVTLDLLRGKTKDVAEHLAELAQYRETIVTRMGQIGDYLNWYEATQMHGPSNAFDAYVKTADELSAPPKNRDDAISRYLTKIQSQME